MAVFDPTLPEQWYPVPGFPLYTISSHLRLRSHHWGNKRNVVATEGKLIKFHTDDRGYKKLVLWKDGKYHNLYLHRVVAELVHGPIPDGKIVRHLDDDKSNNWPANLAIGTYVENVDDCRRNGNMVVLRGEQRPNAILTERAVIAIRRLAEYGLPVSLLCECFDLKDKTVRNVLDRSRWPHVQAG